MTVREQSGYICAGFYGIQRYLRLTRTGACVPWRDGQTRPRGRPSWTYEHGSRGTWPACGCSVDKCVSYLYPFRVCRVTSRLYITSATSQRPRWKVFPRRAHGRTRHRRRTAGAGSATGVRQGTPRAAGGWERRAAGRNGRREGGNDERRREAESGRAEGHRREAGKGKQDGCKNAHDKRQWEGRAVRYGG